MDDTESETGKEYFPSEISYEWLQGHNKVGLPRELSKPECTDGGLCICMC